MLLTRRLQKHGGENFAVLGWEIMAAATVDFREHQRACDLLKGCGVWVPEVCSPAYVEAPYPPSVDP